MKMPRHSKNNTASSFFTYDPRSAPLRLLLGTLILSVACDSVIGNDSASSIFQLVNVLRSYEERRRLKYGTITQRLGADSIRDFDVCCTCLKQATDAVAW